MHWRKPGDHPSYAGSNVEKVMGSMTFKMTAAKASVSVYKQDKETRKYLPAALMVCMPEMTSKQRTEPLWSRKILSLRR